MELILLHSCQSTHPISATIPPNHHIIHILYINLRITFPLSYHLPLTPLSHHLPTQQQATLSLFGGVCGGEIGGPHGLRSGPDGCSAKRNTIPRIRAIASLGGRGNGASGVGCEIWLAVFNHMACCGIWIVVVDDDLPLESVVRGVQAGVCAWKANWEGWVEVEEESFQYGSLERYGTLKMANWEDSVAVGEELFLYDSLE
jgi:hypothetical protein